MTAVLVLVLVALGVTFAYVAIRQSGTKILERVERSKERSVPARAVVVEAALTPGTDLTYDVLLEVRSGASASRTQTRWVVQNLGLVGLQPGVEHEVLIDPLDPAIVTPPGPNMELSLPWLNPRLKALPS